MEARVIPSETLIGPLSPREAVHNVCILALYSGPFVLKGLSLVTLLVSLVSKKDEL